MVTMTQFLFTAVFLLLGWCYKQDRDIDILKHDSFVFSHMTRRFSFTERLVYEPYDWNEIDEED